MQKVTIQVPVDQSLKQSAEKVAEEYGFSSLQEAIRLFMRQFARRTLAVGYFFKTPDEILTPPQEATVTKKYNRAKKEVAGGKGYTASSVDEMMEKSHSSASKRS